MNKDEKEEALLYYAYDYKAQVPTDKMTSTWLSGTPYCLWHSYETVITRHTAINYDVYG